MSERRVLTDCPEAKDEKGWRMIAAALSGCGLSINCREEQGGLRTIAAAVPGLGVATICCRTLSKEDSSDEQESGLLSREEDKDWGELRLAVGEDVSHRCGSFATSEVEAEMSHKRQTLGIVDLGVETPNSGACTPKTAIKMLDPC